MPDIRQARPDYSRDENLAVAAIALNATVRLQSAYHKCQSVVLRHRGSQTINTHRMARGCSRMKDEASLPRTHGAFEKNPPLHLPDATLFDDRNRAVPLANTRTRTMLGDSKTSCFLQYPILYGLSLRSLPLGRKRSPPALIQVGVAWRTKQSALDGISSTSFVECTARSKPR